MSELKQAEASLCFKQSDRDPNCKISFLTGNGNTGLVVLAKGSLSKTIKEGVFYWCTLVPMKNDKGYMVSNAIPYGYKMQVLAVKDSVSLSFSAIHINCDISIDYCPAETDNTIEGIIEEATIANKSQYKIDKPIFDAGIKLFMEKSNHLYNEYKKELKKTCEKKPLSLYARTES